MFDAFENRVPFGLLRPEEQAALQAEGPWVVWSHDKWEAARTPVWGDSSVYRRARPAPPPLWIDWCVIAPQWRYAARDEDGEVWLYANKPFAICDTWGGAGCVRVSTILAPERLHPGTCDWRDSLIERPEGE